MRNWSAGRFTVVQEFDDIFLVAKAPKDLIRIRVRSDSLVFEQRRSAGDPIFLDVTDVTRIKPEMIGGGRKLMWALKAELRDGRELLVVHSINENEARGLAGALHQHCRSQGTDTTKLSPPPPDASGAAPADDSWSVEAWRNQPPIG